MPAIRRIKDLDRKRSLWIRIGYDTTLLICVFLILGLSGCLHKEGVSNQEVVVDGSIYLKTLNLFDEVHPGYGYDRSFIKEPLHHPKAYALYASAEAHRFSETGDEMALENAINAARWLVTNSDPDEDGEKGWGLPFPWDAGGDGTINPANTEYAIETAFGVQALLDVYDAAIQAGYKAEVSEFPAVAAEAMETFLRGRFNENDTDVIFWYSTVPEDNYHVINTCSMLTGQLQRLSRYPVRNQSIFSKWADRSVLYILAHQQLDCDGNIYWMYYEGKSPVQNRPNDLQHEVYTLQGLFNYKIYGGKYGNLIDCRSLLSTLDRFVSGNKVYQLPVGYTYAPEWQSEAESWARLWGVGYALHFVVQLESYLNETPTLSTRLATLLIKKYRKEEQWLFRPTDNETPFYPRQIAFVLLGFSFYEFRSHGNETKASQLC